jgi:glyoxylase-like metal-dependent hydrolase (beta-lactamase superfamily II)
MSGPTGRSSDHELADRLEAAGAQVFERGWLSSNNVLFLPASGIGATLVDSGYWIHQQQTVELTRRALGDVPLEAVFNTHLHSDHCGGNAALRQAFDCRIVVPAGEHHKVLEWDEASLSYQATGQHCPRFSCDGVLAADESVLLAGRAWRVLASPGHDPESVMLYEPDLRLLISADALWEDGFGVVFPELEGRDAFSEVRSTLDLIASLPVDWVVPGHGRPFSNVPAAIDRARNRLDRFEADPRRHAAHAAKVLIKFHLLEVQALSLADLHDWLDTTRYFNDVHRAHFASVPADAWRTELLQSLCRSNAIGISGGIARNL